MANQLRTSGVFNLGSLGSDIAETVLDADFDSVVLLLDGEGSSITDKSSSSHTITASGDTQVDTAEKKFGSGSIEFDGSGDYLSISDSEDFNMGSGDFTAECWAYFDSLSTTEPFIMGQWSGNVGGTTLNWAIMLSTNTGYVRFITSSNGSGVLFDLSTSTTSFSLSTSTWYHIAAVRNGNSFKIFVDGVERASTTNSSALYNATNAFTIGAESDGQQQAMNGYLDDIRVTKGVARYTGSFTPPAALPTTGAVAGVTKPTRKWGGLVGRSIIASDALVKTGNLKLSELLQATYPAPISYGVGTGGNNSYQATIDGQLYQFREFTSSGTFNVTTAGTFDVLLVGGGGEAGGRISGGGGGGAVMLTSTTHSGSGVNLTAGNHTITIGAGGTGGGNSAAGNNGGSTTAFGITATGGGGGGSYFQSAQTLGRDGANGGGAGAFATGTYSGGSGTAPTFPAGITGNVYAGYNGGSSQWAANISTGGGAGAAADGTDAASATAGNGGDGVQITNFEQTDYYYGGGGAGVYYNGATMGTGGNGGGAGSGDTNGRNTAGNGSGTNGGTNTGGGGAGTLSNSDADNGGAGGSGIVVIRYAI